MRDDRRPVAVAFPELVLAAPARASTAILAKLILVSRTREARLPLTGLHSAITRELRRRIAAVATLILKGFHPRRPHVLTVVNNCPEHLAFVGSDFLFHVNLLRAVENSLGLGWHELSAWDLVQLIGDKSHLHMLIRELTNFRQPIREAIKARLVRDVIN